MVEMIDRITPMLKMLKFEEPVRSPAAKAQKTDLSKSLDVVKPIMVNAAAHMDLSLDDFDYTRSFWDDKLRNQREIMIDIGADTGMESDASWQNQRRTKKKKSKLAPTGARTQLQGARNRGRDHPSGQSRQGDNNQKDGESPPTGNIYKV